MFDPVEAIQDFIRFPSVSTDPDFQEGMLGARDYIAGLLGRIGCEVEIVETARHPVVLAYRDGPADAPHVLIYGHYDVQPADPYEKWNSKPFEPEIRDGRLYGRGAADNKGPMMVHIAAVARLLEKHPDAPIRITFLIEGEEEIGSPSFAKVLESHKDRLKGDFVLLSDTQSPSPDQIAITTALRGVVCLQATLEGARSDLHSGLHGGAILNPIQALSELCASLHTADGKVNIPGFYDDVVDMEDWVRDEILKLGNDEKAYADAIGVKGFYTVNGLSPFEVTRLMPTLEFNGIGGGYQGKGSKTIVPSSAFVKISCRLVANQKPAEIEALLRKTLEERCSPLMRFSIQPDHDGAPYQVVPPGKPNTPADQNKHLATAFRAADKAIEKAFGKPPLYLPEGGSVPIIGELKRVLGMDSIMIGMFTPTDNLHAPNEGLDLQMFKRGIEASEQILREVAGV